MSTTEQASHVSLVMPSESSTASSTDNFQFMSDTFTLPNDGQTQIPLAQGKIEFENQIRHRGWLGGTLDKQGYGWLLDTTNDDEDLTTEDNRPIL